MPTKSSKENIEPLIPILKSQVIPCWERFGGGRLAVTAKTLRLFQRQDPPELMRTSVKKRIGKKVTSHTRGFNNTSSFSESWPEDDQAVFRYPALIFIVSGQADFHVADYVIHCPTGHFLLFSNGVPRSIGGRSHLEGDNLDSRQCTVLWFFEPPGTNSVTAYICHSEGKKHWSENYHVVHQSKVLHLYKALMQEIEDRGKFVDLCFSSFLQFYLRELEQGQFHRTGSVSASHAQESVASPITEAKQYIKSHLNHQLTSESVAAEVYMSRTNFLRHWSRESGPTFHEYITQQRMEAARQLLQDGRWSINFICRSVGLRPTQFRAQFTKYFGVTPSAFREKSSRLQKMVRKR